jgi:purine-binding chemotaxis protein CheW
MDEKEEGLFLYEEPEELPEEERRPKPRVTLVPFSLADEWYALDIGDVLEVQKVVSITKVPGLPDFILGVTNIRGNIISITDPKRLFGLAETSITPESRIIVIQAAKKTTALLVDSVGKTLSLTKDFIQPALSTIPEIKADYIEGEAKLADGRLLTILDVEKIMSSEQMRFE